jgi:hypothetical protein
MTPIDHSARRDYRYYDLIMAAFVTVYICSNLIGPGKGAQLDLPIVGTVPVVRSSQGHTRL